jgi:hypothetical protein
MGAQIVAVFHAVLNAGWSGSASYVLPGHDLDIMLGVS